MFFEMTWAEIGACLDYIYRYDINENHCKQSVKLNDWIYKGRDNLSQNLKEISAKLRNK